jgi:hypothetical protein
MKLFHYDTKHQQVHGSVDLGNLSSTEITLVNKVLEFLLDQVITDGRYKCLIVADDITVMDVSDGLDSFYEPQLVIRGSY